MLYIDYIAETLAKEYKNYTSFSIWEMFWYNKEFCLSRSNLDVLISIGKRIIKHSPASYKAIQLAYVIGRIEGDIS